MFFCQGHFGVYMTTKVNNNPYSFIKKNKQNLLRGPIYGYKAFLKDNETGELSCRNEIFNPKKIIDNLDKKLQLIPCEYGYHFCLDIASAAYWYTTFISSAKTTVFHRIKAYEVLLPDNWEDSNKIKLVARKFEILEEVTQDEFSSNTGILPKTNHGDYNDGTYNSGDRNIGHTNIGNKNIGNQNIGALNIGNSNLGDYNIGSMQSGTYNINHLVTSHFSMNNEIIYMFGKRLTKKQMAQMNTYSSLLAMRILRCNMMHTDYNYIKTYMNLFVNNIPNATEAKIKEFYNHMHKERSRLEKESIFNYTKHKSNKIEEKKRG